MARGNSALPAEPVCVNRRAQHRQLDELWAASGDGAPLRAAVVGPSGIGKTVLLLSMAYKIRSAFSKVVYVEVPRSSARTLVTAEDLAAEILGQWDIEWAGLPGARRTSLVREKIAAERVLLILDRIDRVDQVLPLLGDLGRGAVLVGAGPDPRPWRTKTFALIEVPGFEDADGVELIRRFAGASVADTDDRVLEQLVRLCGGHPEFLVLAATHLADGDESPAEYIRWLERTDADQLSGEFSVGSTSVYRAICDSAFHDLTADEQFAFVAFAAMAVPVFDLALAVAVLGRPEREVKRLLRRIVERTPLRVRAGGFYEYSHLAQQYALKQPVGPGVGELADIAGAECVGRAIGLGKALSRRPIPSAQLGRYFDEVPAAFAGPGALSEASTETARQWPVLVAAAVSAARHGRFPAATAIWVALYPFAYQTARTAEAIDGYAEIIRAGRDGVFAEFVDDPALRWHLHRDLGTLHERIGEFGAALEQFALAAATGYPPGLASCLEWQAITLEQLGRPADALATLVESWAAVVLLEDEEQRERSYALLRQHRARIRVGIGDGDGASLDDARTALAYFETSEHDRHNAARCHVLLGDIARLNDDPAEAVTQWTASLDGLLAHRMFGDVAMTHDKLAALAETEGRVTDAANHRERAVEYRFGIQP